MQRSKRAKYTDPKSYTPNSRQIGRIIASKKQAIFEDEVGRIYGFIDTNKELSDNLESIGEVDNEVNFLMWVRVPRKRRNFNEAIEPVEDSSNFVDFPELDEVVKLSDYYTSNYALQYAVYSYPERFERNSPATSIVLTKLK